MIAQPHRINTPGFGFVDILQKRGSIRHPMVPESQANAHFDASHTMPPDASLRRPRGNLATDCSPFCEGRQIRHSDHAPPPSPQYFAVRWCYNMRSNILAYTGLRSIQSTMTNI